MRERGAVEEEEVDVEEVEMEESVVPRMEAVEVKVAGSVEVEVGGGKQRACSCSRCAATICTDMRCARSFIRLSSVAICMSSASASCAASHEARCAWPRAELRAAARDRGA